MNRPVLNRYLLPAFVCLSAADEPTAIAVACTLQEKTFRDQRDQNPRLYFDDSLPTVVIPANRPFDNDPHTLLELDTLDLGVGHVGLLDVMLNIRRDLTPLVDAAIAFLGAPHQGSGVKAMAEVNAARAALEAALKPFDGHESAVLATGGTQAPAESVQDGLQVTDAVETTLVRAGVPHITVQLPVTDELCASILCTALEGGTGYWAAADKIERRDVPAERRAYEGEFEYVSVELSDTEAQDEDDEPAFPPQVVDYAAIRRGLQRVIAGEVKVRRDLVAACQASVTGGDGGDIDADAADVIVQAAMFGELVFG